MRNEDDTGIPTLRPSNVNRNYSLIKGKQKANGLAQLQPLSAAVAAAGVADGSGQWIRGLLRLVLSKYVPTP